MDFAPRFLHVDNEADALKALASVGVDPAGIQRMAGKMIRHLVKLRAVPCRAANILKQEMLALGGDAAVARGSVACQIPTTDVVLIGSRKKLRKLCERLPHQPFGLARLSDELGDLLDRAANPPQIMRGRNCRLDLTRPNIMGILNVTPDSFSDGGVYASSEMAIRRGIEMSDEGADLIDIGGESTRPGAEGVGTQEEIDRVVPVVEGLCGEIDLPISIDTSKSDVAREAIRAGAHFVNDISGLHFDDDMPSVVAESDAGLFLMHTRGRPDTMQRDVFYDDLVSEVMDYLSDSIEKAVAAGVPEEKIAIDPGIGFGKDSAGNLELLRRLSELSSLGYPVLLGSSRKSFIGKILQQKDPQQRVYGTLATVALGVEQGATIFRVHDIRPARDVALTAWAICRDIM
ncbi:MAG TPA: dihydropteroate synthase [Desulfuromonadales bacterium]|nr:dihydropteroate synthase [Desulfuromonadales bacterium]